MLHAAMPKYHSGDLAKEKAYASLAKPSKEDTPHSLLDLGKEALKMHHRHLHDAHVVDHRDEYIREHDEAFH